MDCVSKERRLPYHSLTGTIKYVFDGTRPCEAPKPKVKEVKTEEKP